MIEPRSNSIGYENVKEPEPSTKIQPKLNGSIPFELLNNKASDGRSILIELKSDYQKNFFEIMAKLPSNRCMDRVTRKMCFDWRGQNLLLAYTWIEGDLI